jgi:hypothetical protein
MSKYPRAEVVEYTGPYSPRSSHDHYEVYKVFNRFGNSFKVSVHASGYVGITNNLTGRWCAGTMSQAGESWEQTVERLGIGHLTRDDVEQNGTVLVEQSNT